MAKPRRKQPKDKPNTNSTGKSYAPTNSTFTAPLWLVDDVQKTSAVLKVSVTSVIEAALEEWVKAKKAEVEEALQTDPDAQARWDKRKTDRASRGAGKIAASNRGQKGTPKA